MKRFLSKFAMADSLLVLAVISFGICVISTGAWAVQLAPSGQNIVTCEVTALPLDEGHSLTLWKGKGVTLTVANSPDHMSHIDCVGTIENMADKSFKASGYCLHADRDGDKWIDRWWNDSTMKKGRWEVTGVSGKWKEVRATGSFVYTDLLSGSTCEGVSSWEVDR